MPNNREIGIVLSPDRFYRWREAGILEVDCPNYAVKNKLGMLVFVGTIVFHAIRILREHPIIGLFYRLPMLIFRKSEI